MSRMRIRCLHVSGESKDGKPFEARVGIVDGEELSPEAMKAFLNICSAAADRLAVLPEPTPEARVQLKRLAKKTRRK